jgi:hypothetical protein
VGLPAAVASSGWIALGIAWVVAAAQFWVTRPRARRVHEQEGGGGVRARIGAQTVSIAGWLGGAATALVWFVGLRGGGTDLGEYLFLFALLPVTIMLAMFPAGAVAVAWRWSDPDYRAERSRRSR